MQLLFLKCRGGINTINDLTPKNKAVSKPKSENITLCISKFQKKLLTYLKIL